MKPLILDVPPTCKFCEKEGLVYIMKSKNMIKTTVFTMCDVCKKELHKITKE